MLAAFHDGFAGNLVLPMSAEKQRHERTLVMFGYDWDAIAFAKLKRRWPQARYGFDLFTFPSNARLAMFDMERFCAMAAVKARLTGAKAVVSNHEQFGALAAALLAERMGWPGTPVEAVLACQHKLHARGVLHRVAPEANPGFQRLDVEYGGDIPDGLAYPAFVKPVKAAFSVLARQVGSRAELADHTRFGPWELWVIKHLVQPFEKIVRQRLPEAGTAHSLMLETPMRGLQYCLDGYAFDGKYHTLGVVDAIMYPGTEAFMRWEYPSRLDAAQVAQAEDIARRFLREIGFDHGLFNMEFIVDAQTGQVKVIEFNPRLAAQFSDLYARVDGIDMHEIALALGHGIDPETLPRAEAVAGCASSLVYRSFDPEASVTMPGKRQRQRLQQQFPDSLLFRFPKKPQEIYRDFKWLGSYRYGILHLGARDPEHLRLRCEQASALLDWPPPYAGHRGGVESLPDEVNDWAGETDIEKVTG